MDRPIESENSGPLLRKVDMKDPFLTKKVIIGIVLVGLFGVGTGYYLAGGGKSSFSLVTSGKVSNIGSKTVIGSDDLKTFKDVAEGVLSEGGIDGEGQYHLVRPGGESQNVYMTSSLVDLSQFIGKKIKVWGQTQTAKKAGWLMDVGRVEIL